MPFSDEGLRRYRLLLASQRSRLSGLLVAAWDALDRYDEDGIADFVTRTTPALAGAKAAAVATSAGFFAIVLDVRPVGVRPEQVPVDARIRDPFLALWHATKEGRPIEEGFAAGRSMAEAVGADFVQRTARRTGDAFAEASGIKVRHRRIPEPTACPWCRTVAGQLYRTAESADFGHDRCFCDVVPVEGRRKVLTETDPARRRRLEERARRWDQRAAEFDARDGR